MMTLSISVWLLLALSMATALVAGVFLTFSDFIMKSLRATQPAGGTEAMQIINRKVYRSLFMVLLMGMVPVSGLIGIYAGVALPNPLSGWLTAGAILYIAGVFLVTAFGNVPMNHKLEALPQAGAAAQAYWPPYVTGWTRWNHVRWVAALGAAICYAIGAVLMAANA